MPKKKNFDKQAVARKLDTLVNNVSKRGIFVVTKNERYYQIINYMNNTVVLDEIPTKIIADRFCDKINNNKKISVTWFKKIRELLDNYAKLDYDCIYYTYTIENTEDEIRRTVSQFRREQSIGRMQRIIDKLKSS